MCSFGKCKCTIWKILGIFGTLFGILMGLCALFTAQKNQEYKDALIDLSDSFPEPDSEARKQDWQASNAPENRKTTEERLKDNRITEDE